MTDVSAGFRPPCWCPSRWAPTWLLHTNLYKFGENVSPHISHKKHCCDLNLGESLCISTFFLFPDSRLNLLNGFDFFILIYFEWRDIIGADNFEWRFLKSNIPDKPSNYRCQIYTHAGVRGQTMTKMLPPFWEGKSPVKWLTLDYQNFDGRSYATKERSDEGALEPSSLPKVVRKYFFLSESCVAKHIACVQPPPPPPKKNRKWTPFQFFF